LAASFLSTGTAENQRRYSLWRAAPSSRQKKGTPMALSRCVKVGRAFLRAKVGTVSALSSSVEIARNAKDQQARASLLHMAQVWFRLAEERVNETDERQSATS
jgi:hypothetical protein